MGDVRGHGRLAVGRACSDPTAPSTSPRAATCPGSPDQSAVPGIQRVNADGSVEMLSTEIGGHTAGRPERPRLRAGRPALVHRLGHRAGRPLPARSARRGRLYVLGSGGGGEFLMERPGVYPNGIAFDAQGRLYWTESAAHRVCRLRRRPGDDVLPAQRRPRARRDGVRRRRPAVRLHDDLGRRHRALGRRRGARGDRRWRARHQLHLRRPDAVRHRHEGGRDPRRPAHRHVLERRDRRQRRRCRCCPAGCSGNGEPVGTARPRGACPTRTSARSARRRSHGDRPPAASPARRPARPAACPARPPACRARPPGRRRAPRPGSRSTDDAARVGRRRRVDRPRRARGRAAGTPDRASSRSATSAAMHVERVDGRLLGVRPAERDHAEPAAREAHERPRPRRPARRRAPPAPAGPAGRAACTAVDRPGERALEVDVVASELEEDAAAGRARRRTTTARRGRARSARSCGSRAGPARPRPAPRAGGRARRALRHW